MGAKLLLLRNFEAKQKSKANILIHMQRILINPGSLKAYSFFALTLSFFNPINLCMSKWNCKAYEIYYHLVQRSVSSALLFLFPCSPAHITIIYSYDKNV